MKWIPNPLVLFLGCLALASCGREEQVNLTPNDPRPIYGVTVADADEVALLQQQLKLEPVTAKNTTLYFFAAPGLVEKLVELGYAPAQEAPYRVFERVVRVNKKGAETELLKTGVELINRERDYWVVRGSLAQLTAIQRIGYRITNVDGDEPRPREIKVAVHSLEDVRAVYALHVDVFTVQELKEGYLVYGGAFDRQIDRMREKGFEVELISTIGEEGKR